MEAFLLRLNNLAMAEAADFLYAVELPARDFSYASNCRCGMFV